MPDAENNGQSAVRETIRAGAELNVSFLLMNLLATVIACYGLFANSPAIIIGAMIVALLLGPIVGLALSLVDSDTPLFTQSLTTLITGSIAVMVVAYLIGRLHGGLPLTDEILARTHPNLIDLMVALAGGAAGAYALVSPRLGTALVGVAVATALVPPLCSASILFAHGEFRLGGGAFLLAFTNMVAIQFASSVVLWSTGFRRVSRTSGLSAIAFIKRNAVSLIILLSLAFFLTRSLHQAVAQQWFQTSTEAALRRMIGGTDGNYLVGVRFEKGAPKDSRNTTLIKAVTRGPIAPTAAQIAAMESELPPPPDGSAIELRVRFVETRVFDRNGQLYKDDGFRGTE